jgi:hypothetical protein
VFKSTGAFNTDPSYVAKARGGTVTTDGTYWDSHVPREQERLHLRKQLVPSI